MNNWKYFAGKSSAIRARGCDLEMLGVVADTFYFESSGFFKRLKLILRRLFFIGLPPKYATQSLEKKCIHIHSSLPREDYKEMVISVQERLSNLCCIKTYVGTVWKLSNFLNPKIWIISINKCIKYSLLTKKADIVKNIFIIISTAHAVKCKKKLQYYLLKSATSRDMVIFLNSANCLESIWCSAYEEFGIKKTISLQHAHYFKFNPSNVPFDQVNYFNISANHCILWTKKVANLICEFYDDLSFHIGGEILPSKVMSLSEMYNYDSDENVVVFLARDFHYQNNINLLQSLYDSGIHKVKICFHPTSEKSKYKIIKGLVIEEINKKSVTASNPIIFVVSSSVYFDLLKLGIFSILFVSTYSEFDGIVMARNSDDIKDIFYKKYEFAEIIRDQAPEFLSNHTGYRVDNYKSIIENISV